MCDRARKDKEREREEELETPISDEMASDGNVPIDPLAFPTKVLFFRVS